MISQVVALVAFAVLVPFISFLVGSILTEVYNSKTLYKVVSIFLTIFLLEIFVVVLFLLGLLLFIGLGLVR